MSGTLSSQSDQERLVRRQIMARLWTLSLPAYCALLRLLLGRSGYSTITTLTICYDARPDTDMSGAEGSGLDLLAICHTDLATFVTAIRIKTGRVPTPRTLIDEMRGVMQRAGADQGLIFASGLFSRRTHRIAATPHLPPLRLIDGDELATLLVQYRLGVRRSPGAEQAWEFDPCFFVRLEQQIRETTGQRPLTGDGHQCGIAPSVTIAPELEAPLEVIEPGHNAAFSDS